jgi:hypothetical protein
VPTDDNKLTEIALAQTLNPGADVITMLRQLEAAVAADDGVKSFNLLYLNVSEGVRDQSAMT